MLAELRRLRGVLTAAAHTSKEYKAAQGRISELAAETRAALDEPLGEHFSDAGLVRALHWAVEFPEAFVDEGGQPLGEAAGFDVVIGNPPWEIVKPDLREFYAQFDPEIESHLNRKDAEKRIKELQAEDPAREALWEIQSRKTEESAAYYSASPDYTRQGRGDRATHKLFMERAWGLLKDNGRLGYVVPSGIYTDLGTKELREMLLNEGSIEYLYSFSNERFFFTGVDHRFKFALIGAHKGEQSDGFWAAFRFNPRVAVRSEELPGFLADQGNLIYMRRESIAKFSPDSLGIMEFQTSQDYRAAERIYANHPTLSSTISGTWNVKFTREFDKTNDRQLFNYSGKGLPVYEGENFGFYGDALRPPSIWIEEPKGRTKLLSPLKRQAPEIKDEKIPLDYEHYRFGFRRIARATDIRTLIVSYLPSRAFSMYTLTTTVQHYYDGSRFVPFMDRSEEIFLYSCMASFVLDYLMRFQVSSSVAMFNAYSLPVPRLTKGNPYFDALIPRAARLTCTRAEFAGLWKEVMGKKWPTSPPAPLRNYGEGSQLGGGYGPPAIEAGERQRLRDEIDALVAHLYGLSREDFEHILGTFPLVFPDDAAGRIKKETLLGVYDEFEGVVKGWGRV